jgi:peptidyl-prolyl cis-trans isomerase B (cyclophilin B)
MPLISTLVVAALIAPQRKPVLEPTFSYNGINREFPVIINAPRSKKLLLQVLNGKTRELVWEATVKGGKHDLAKVFPKLWSEPRKDVLFVQLATDKGIAGSALVLQPMTNPAVCTLDPTTKNPKWEPDEDNTYAGVRVWQSENVVIDTEFGEAEFEMCPEEAPNTVFNFVQLVSGGFYRDVIFHRIVQKHPRTGKMFVIQAGDPTGTGMGSPGYSFILEKSSIKHDFGVLGMARSTDPNTNGSQFYVALSREATQHLDGRYVTFGKLVRGKEVIEKIASVEIGPKDDRPVKPPLIKNARLVPHSY